MTEPIRVWPTLDSASLMAGLADLGSEGWGIRIGEGRVHSREKGACDTVGVVESQARSFRT